MQEDAKQGSVGRGIPRFDGYDKVTGRALYAADIQPEGCLHGVTVRSDRPHARIVAIERDPAFDWTGITVVTAQDLRKLGVRNVVYLQTEDQPVLADGVVRHVFEPVALVAAPTRTRAVAAARHLRITYADRPALLDYESAEGHPISVQGEGSEWADNVFTRLEIRKGDPKGTPTGGHVHLGVYRTAHQEQLYIEPQGMLALPRPDGGLCLVGSMQCPYYVQTALEHMLGPEWADGRVNVAQAATGGGFGGKEEYPSMIAAHALVLSLATRRPVKIVYERSEDLCATTKRHPSTTWIRSVCDDEGRLIEWTARIVIDAGAYVTLSPVVLSRALIHLTGPYRCPHVHLVGRAVATHSPPNGAFRGFGAPQAMWAVERHMDRIAREMGIDPVELRRRNLYRDGDITATGQVLRNPGGFAVLEEALEAARAPLPERRPVPGGGRRLSSGRGVSLVFHGCGFTGNGEAWLAGKVSLVLHPGDSWWIELLTSSTDIGQGSETVLPQIVAEELGIETGRVRTAPHDTGAVPDSGPTVASRTCMVVGGCVQKAAVRLRQALQAETGLDADDFEALLAARPSTEPLRVDYQYEDTGALRWDPETYQGDAYPTYGWACNVVDLDVDLDTGEVIHRRLVSATDVGRAINPVIVQGQLEGGALQALGYATSEEVVLDARGGMKNNRLSDYIIPTTVDAPEIVARIVEIPYAEGPFGAKGIGEIPMDGPASAVAQAIEAATGVVLDQLPMTPERVLGAMSRRSR